LSAAASAGRGRSPFVAASLSLLLPGLGQLSLGRWRVSLLFLVPGILATGWVILQVGHGLAWFGLSLFDQAFEGALIAVLAFLGLWRVVAAGHAYLIAARVRRSRKWETAVLSAVVVSIVAVHSVAIAATWKVYQTGAEINANNMVSDEALIARASAAPSEEPDPVQTATPPASVPFIPFGTQLASQTPSPTYPVNNDRITFLLAGVDFMTGRSHSLTDTMMLATLDVRTNKATIISVPRDTSNFDLYYGGWVSYKFKLNTLMSAASVKSFGSPDSGIETLKKEIGFLVGLPIDYYVAVDLEGFVAMVEAIGGVDIDVKVAINDPFTGTFVPKGMVHMDGHLALKYCRSRESSSDYARAARQQDVLIALAKKVITPEVVLKLPELLTLAGTAISTDFPMKYARNFVTAFKRVGKPYKCVLGPPYSYHPASSTTGGNWTSRLDIARVASLSVWLFGRESLYYGRPGVVPAPCATTT
jgi:LCP family protein required for cell wall assembly